MSWYDDMAIWARETLNAHSLPWPSGYSWEQVIRKLATLEEDLWNLRGALVTASKSGVTQLELDAFELAADSLYRSSLFIAKGLVAAGVPKSDIPEVKRMPSVSAGVIIPSAVTAGVKASGFGAVPYKPGVNIRYNEFAAGFGSVGSLGWGQAVLAYLGGALLLMAAGGLIAWAILEQMAPDEHAAAVEATRAQVEVVSEIRGSQDSWDELCAQILASGGSCPDELGTRPGLPITDLSEIGESAPSGGFFESVGKGATLLVGGAIAGALGYFGWKIYRATR